MHSEPFQAVTVAVSNQKAGASCRLLHYSSGTASDRMNVLPGLAESTVVSGLREKKYLL